MTQPRTPRTLPELELAEVRTLTKMGKSKGNLTDEEIQGALSDIDLTDEQFERVYTHFRESGIEVVDELVGADVTLEVVRRPHRCRGSADRRRPRRHRSRSRGR